MTDEEIRATFRWILADDPHCPLTDEARRDGSDEPATVVLMAGFLMGTIYKAWGEAIDTSRARRIVLEEFATRRAARLVH